MFRGCWRQDDGLMNSSITKNKRGRKAETNTGIWGKLSRCDSLQNGVVVVRWVTKEDEGPRCWSRGQTRGRRGSRLHSGGETQHVLKLPTSYRCVKQVRGTKRDLVAGRGGWSFRVLEVTACQAGSSGRAQDRGCEQPPLPNDFPAKSFLLTAAATLFRSCGVP